jgi:hypothetical protein
MTDELSFNPAQDSQCLRRDIALALLLRSFSTLLTQTSRHEDISDSVGALIPACWKIADQFMAAGQRLTP